MISRAAVALLVALVAAGCATQPLKPTKKYQLPVTGAEKAAASPEGELRPPLRVARIRGPSWLRKRTMFYQLNFRTPPVMGWYGQSRWIAPPTVMVGRALRSQLMASGRWRAILAPEDPARAEWVLQVDLLEFIQVFPETDKSFGQLRARALLLVEQSDQVLAQQRFSYRVLAPSPNAEGGVQALGKAASHLLEDIRRWLLAAPMP